MNVFSGRARWLEHKLNERQFDHCRVDDSESKSRSQGPRCLLSGARAKVLATMSLNIPEHLRCPSTGIMMDEPVILIRNVGSLEQSVTYEKRAVLRLLGSGFGDAPFVRNTSVTEAGIDFLASMVVSAVKGPIYLLPENELGGMAASLLGRISSDSSIPVYLQDKARLIGQDERCAVIL